MKILHINTFNQTGGAETIAYSLLKSNGENRMLVKESFQSDVQIQTLSKNLIDSFFLFLNKIIWKLGIKKVFKKAFFIEEEFNCTYQKLKKTTAYQQADIIHLHNIHGGYFDLNALIQIAKEKKIVWTLHDMWPITGGEAHVFENENYKKGIGATPYKHIPPISSPIIDRRQHYLELKKKIYCSIHKNLCFVPVSNWLENCLLSSYVYDKKIKEKMIYNGYDDSVFYTIERNKNELVKILIFSAQNPFKGESIFEEVLSKITVPFELIVVGKNIFIDGVKTTTLPYISDRKKLADLFRSIDVLIFPSNAESFGLVPLEAMACGVCVFASAVGGIPEIIQQDETGFLFNSKEILIKQLNTTLQNINFIHSIGSFAAKTVKNKFTLTNMIQEYNNVYNKLFYK